MASDPSTVERQIAELRSLLAEGMDWDGYQMDTVRSGVAALLNRVRDADHRRALAERHADQIAANHVVSTRRAALAEAALVEMKRSPAPRDPLDVLSVDQLCNLGDDETVTVEGTLTYIEYRTNRAGVPTATLTVADIIDPEITTKVDVPPATFKRAINRRRADGTTSPRLGDRVLVQGVTTVRTTLSADDIRAVGDWHGATDPVVYAKDGPPFTPFPVSQFRAGYEQTRGAIARDAEDGAL